MPVIGQERTSSLRVLIACEESGRLGPPRGIGYAFAYAAAKRMAARNGSTFYYWFAARNPVASSSDEDVSK